MTFLSSRVIGLTAEAERAVVAAVAIAFPSIIEPGLRRDGPELFGGSGRGIVIAGRNQESLESKASGGAALHNSQFVFATSV